VPLAVAVAARPRARAVVLAFAGVLQTVPSLALLALLIAVTGRIGVAPAIVALTLYALLPIVRNTVTGMAGVPAGLRDAADALALSRRQRLRLVELPIALPTVVAGIRTATVIGVGTATIAAFIGAGGYGERIVTGLALNDPALMLAGAVPSAVLAIVLDASLGLLERNLRRG
jgi:osmoprotectant transport system permease protein